MTEIYWMQVIGNLGSFAVLVLIIAIIAMCILLIGYCAFGVYDDDRKKRETITKWLRRSFVAIFISSIGVIFIPSEKEILAIYGIGGTIDYIKSNDKAKELPDKVVDALTRYLDEINKEENKDE